MHEDGIYGKHCNLDGMLGLLRFQNYRDIQWREFGIRGRTDLRAILNRSKLVTKAIQFMDWHAKA
jgi:hypothetical protein